MRAVLKARGSNGTRLGGLRVPKKKKAAALCAWVGRSSTSNLEIYSRSRADLGPRAEQQLLGTRRPPRRVPFDARALSMARMSS